LKSPSPALKKICGPAFAKATAWQATTKAVVAPASGGCNSATRRIGLADEQPELIAPSKNEPHPPTVSGVTPETTRETRVLPTFSSVSPRLCGEQN